jgi:cell division protein FtsI (penicillin-binding protein 3)
MKASTAEQLTSILTTVVAQGTGTAAAIEGYTIAGKTGTAEKASREGGYLIGEYIISFVGYFANSDSNIVCLTSLDNPYTEAGTGPLFRDIMQFAATRYLIAPDQLPAPDGTEE